MSVMLAAPIKYKVTPLRIAQRELTRSRIRDAARDLFFERHFDATTMDQIAVAAGLRRSTVYLHYKDKAEILADIAADFVPRSRKIFALLPGPIPTVAQIQRWIHLVTQFCVHEKASLAILQEVSHETPGLPSLRLMATELFGGLSQNVPAFRTAADPKKVNDLVRARAEMLMLQLTFACNHAIYSDDKPHALALRKAVAEAFAAFINTHDPARPA